MEAFGCYDQLNLPALAGAEILFRRFQTIIEAHAVPGAKPNYLMASAYSGIALLEDGVAPELRVYGARKIREKQVEVSVQRAGAGLGAPHADAGGAGAAAAAAPGLGDDAMLPPGGAVEMPPAAAGKGAKGRGRGRGRRGLGPPAAAPA
eukprot:7102823-Lingulodinium_polyedra.AAC.2